MGVKLIELLEEIRMNNDLLSYLNDSYKKRGERKTVVDKQEEDIVTIFSILEDIKDISAGKNTMEVKSRKCKLLRKLIQIKSQNEQLSVEDKILMILRDYDIIDSVINATDFIENTKIETGSFNIIYGPPLSGKTFLQNRINQRCLIIDSDGFSCYEDIIDFIWWNMHKGQDIYLFTNRHEWINKENLGKIEEKIMPFRDKETINLKFILVGNDLIAKLFDEFIPFDLSWINISDFVLKCNRYLMVGNRDLTEIISQKLEHIDNIKEFDVTVQFIKNIVR